MPTDPISPDEVPASVPGHLTVASPAQGWDGVAVRGYRYGPSEVHVPAIRDHVVIAYRRGDTAMRRRVGSRWRDEQLRPGDVSLLTRDAESDWWWPESIEVVHVYLSHDQLAAACRHVHGRGVTDIELRDELRADAAPLHGTAMALAAASAAGATASRLLVDELTVELCTRIVRGHADVRLREPGAGEAALSFAQERAVRAHVHDHLDQVISLDDLAAAVGLSRFHFARRFRRTTGSSPHEFVLSERVDRAVDLVQRSDVPLADVAARCGFADQSHMNRVFRRRLRTTPGRLRAGA